MNCISTKDFMSIYRAVSELESKYNPSVLRHLRRDIYELANSTKPTDKIVATGFENLDDIEKIDKFVLGVGVVKNGHMIKAEQLYEDVIFDNQYFNPAFVLEEYLPELLKRNPGGLPMYKYIKEYSGEVFERVKENMLKYTTVDAFLNQQLRIQKANYHKMYGKLSVKEIIENEGFDTAYRKLIFLDEEEILLDDLHDYLYGFIKEKTAKCLKDNPELKRLIRIYDLIKYK